MVGRAIGWPSASAGILVLSGVAVAVTTYTFRCVASYFEPSPPDGTPRQPRPVKADVREWALL